nr:tetratricopeptide repeat protein [Bacteroidota bacterium]
MKNQLFCLVFLFLIIFTTIGQQREYQVADSLLTDYLSDTSAQRVIKLEGVMNYSSLLPPELMIRYAKKVDSILDLKSDSLLEYAVNGMFSGAYMKLMVLDSMLKYSKRKLAVAEKYAAFNDPNQNDWKARSLTDISRIGKTYEWKGDMPAALEYYQRCVNVAEEIGYRAYLHYFLLDIATINEEMNNYETTAEYLNLAWDVATENKDSMFLINVQNARAVMYHDMKAYDKALENYYKVLKDCYKYQLYDRIILSQVNIGGVYRDQENWDSALVHYESALNLMDRLNTNVTSKTINSNIGDTIRLFIEIGDLYTQTGDYTQAKRFLDRAGTGIHKIQTVD